MSMFRTLLENMSGTSYTQLNYLQSTGEQYINPGLSGNTNGLYAEFKWSPMSTISNQFVFGVENSSSPYGRIYFKYSNSTALELGCYGYQYISYSTSTGTDYITTANTVKYTTQYVTMNGSTVMQTTNNNSFDRSSLTPYLFAINRGGYPQEYGRIKLYYIKFYDSNNQLLRDFIPVLDENNTPCLYDKVSETYFYNLGLGTFNYG